MKRIKLYFRGLFIFLLFAISKLISASYAIDDTGWQQICFSGDGRYFAYKEFGYKIGFDEQKPLVNIIDLFANKHIKGSPFKVDLPYSPAPLSVIGSKFYIDKLLKQYKPAIDQYQISHYGRIIASNKITELPFDKNSISFRRSYNKKLNRDNIEINIEEFYVEDPRYCQDNGNAVKALAISFKSGEGLSSEIYRDTNISKMIGCPIKYSISDIIRYKKTNKFGYIVMINIFENIIVDGENIMVRKFLAVPVNLP